MVSDDKYLAVTDGKAVKFYNIDDGSSLNPSPCEVLVVDLATQLRIDLNSSGCLLAVMGMLFDQISDLRAFIDLADIIDLGLPILTMLHR